MPPLLATILSYILSWRTLALILAYLNLKSLPPAWHIKLFYLGFKHGRDVRKNQKHLIEASKEHRNVHPVFRPVTTTSSTSWYETDYNLHKSNSTYFADLDHSRTALISALIAPVMVLNVLVPTADSNEATKRANAKPGLIFPVLASGHTSFLREIKPFQKYYMRSRLLTWDRKWLITASYFVRPATKKEKAFYKKKGQECPDEILLACALNKYVLKQGGKTIEPALGLSASGWFNYPETPATAATGETAVGTGSNTPNPVAGPSSATMETADQMQKLARRLSRGPEKRPDIEAISTETGKPTTDVSNVTKGEKTELGGWTWAEIEAERKRGMELAENWLNLDGGLRKEYEYGIEAGFLDR